MRRPTLKLPARLRMRREMAAKYPRKKIKRDFSLRKPTTSQERSGKKKRRLAPFEMTVWWGLAGSEAAVCRARVSEARAEVVPLRVEGFD
jgi:hypothetical protein